MAFYIICAHGSAKGRQWLALGVQIRLAIKTKRNKASKPTEKLGLDFWRRKELNQDFSRFISLFALRAFK